MSTVLQRKNAQGYKTVPNSCGNCENFTSRVVHYKDSWPNRILVDGMGDETNSFESRFRCSIGKFAVAKLATCKKWSAKI